MTSRGGAYSKEALIQGRALIQGNMVCNKIKPEYFLNNRNESSFKISQVTDEEILDVIKSLENKLTGPYSMPLKIIEDYS